MVLIKASYGRKTLNLTGFRPLAGIMVLISPTSNFSIAAIQGCFRPLAGIMVLIGVDEVGTDEAGPAFPSPCGDYGSYPNLAK